MSDELLAELDRAGFVRIPAAFPAAAAQVMCEQIWQHVAREHSIERDEPATWSPAQPTGFQSLAKSGAFADIASEALQRAVDSILGAGTWAAPRQWGAPLVTFPTASARDWAVPHKQWHLDFPARPPVRPLPGLRVLAFIGEVRPRGGGTLVVEGSQRLVERLIEAGNCGEGHSADVRSQLADAHSWFRALTEQSPSDDGVEQFMRAGATLDGVSARVVELLGAPGDVTLLHPWAFHAPSPNCGAAPRMMISHSLFRS